MTDIKQKIMALRIPEERILENEPLSGYTTFRIGGPAELLVEAATEEELSALLGLLTSESIHHMLIGNGSNILFSDEGYDGVVILLDGDFMELELPDQIGAPENRTVIRAGSAVRLSRLSSFAAENGLTGLEFACGIPGSTGGAVYMNAGAYGGEIKDTVLSVRLMRADGSEIFTRDAEHMDFGYRHSAVQDEGLIVLSADFALEKGDRDAIKAFMAELNKKRNSKQPVNFPSAGSTFKRPAGGYAAALIQDSGLKGFSVGGAQVSEKHSGFVINTGGATCRDVVTLMEKVRDKVLEDSGILLEPEVRIIDRDGTELNGRFSEKRRTD